MPLIILKCKNWLRKNSRKWCTEDACYACKVFIFFWHRILTTLNLMFTEHISGIPVSQWHMASVIRNLQSASQVQPKPSFGWYHIILLVKVCMGTAGWWKCAWKQLAQRHSQKWNGWMLSIVHLAHNSNIITTAPPCCTKSDAKHAKLEKLCHVVNSYWQNLPHRRRLYWQPCAFQSCPDVPSSYDVCQHSFTHTSFNNQHRHAVWQLATPSVINILLIIINLLKLI